MVILHRKQNCETRKEISVFLLFKDESAQGVLNIIWSKNNDHFGLENVHFTLNDQKIMTKLIKMTKNWD